MRMWRLHAGRFAALADMFAPCTAGHAPQKCGWRAAARVCAADVCIIYGSLKKGVSAFAKG